MSKTVLRPRRVRIPAVREAGPVPWRAWARSLVGTTPTQAAVLSALAGLADWRGEMIVSVGWLCQEAMRPERSVKRALAELEADGVLVRSRRRWGGHQAASLVTLVPAPVARDGGEEPVIVYSFPEVVPEGVVVGPDDNEGLRSLICRSQDAGWVGEDVEVLARSLTAAAPSQMSTAIRRGREISRLGAQEALLDTIGWAWQALREDASGQIVGARSPWAVWTTATTRLVLHQRDVLLPESAFDPSLLPATGCDMPGEMSKASVGLAELEGPLGRAVAELIRAGMPETLAWGGTRRVAQLALRGHSRAHTFAGQDPRLGDLGVGPECARAWMTLVVGSRKGAKASLLAASDSQITEQALVVVGKLRNGQ